MSRIKFHDEAELYRFAQQLVRTPSESGQEGAVAELVAEEMRYVGFPEVRIDALGNVIGRIGPEDGPALLYDAHMDTVGIGEPSAWPHDPYGGEIADGVLYGRGACDMKGALAAMVYAGQMLCMAQAPLKGPLYVVAVVQEEPCEGAAIRHVIEREGIRPNWVVLGEATNLQLARGQRGRLELRVRVRGRACHASAPERGVNAIYEAARLVVALELLSAQLGHDSFLGDGTVAVTEIISKAGSHNVVPDHCELYIDRRLTIGETESAALRQVRRAAAREGVDAEFEIPVYRAESYTGVLIEQRESFPYWITPEDEPLLVQAARTIERELGFVPRVGKWEFSTDGVYTMGIAGIPTIGFGPGEERYAHTVQDQVRLRDLADAARVYAALALAMLR